MSEILTTETDSVRATLSSQESWKNSMKSAIRDGAELLEQLGLIGVTDASQAAAAQFPVFVTREFLSRMRPGDPHDPLLRQVLPLGDEMVPVSGYSHDPLMETDATTTNGLLQKYSGRALLVITGACAIHCRYCFRRHFPYSEIPHSIDAWLPAIDRIAADDTIEELLLSGGDPLMLVDSTLSSLIDQIEQIPHVRRLRIHTRLPIVLPSRVTEDLVNRLVQSPLTSWMVVHINHPNEIDASVIAGLARMIDHGIPVLNQTVLLRGVNDRAETLIALSKRLIDARVTPYYLHQLDRVAGAGHFAVDESIGHQLIDQMRASLPGYAVPRYVVERPGEPAKMPV